MMETPKTQPTMSVPSAFTRGCALDSNFNGCSTTALLNLHLIQPDLSKHSLKCAQRISSAVRKTSIPYEQGHALHTHVTQGCSGPKNGNIRMTGTQIQLIGSSSAHLLSRDTSTNSVQSTETTVLTSDVKSSAQLRNLTSHCVMQYPYQTESTSLSCDGLHLEDDLVVSGLDEEQADNKIEKQRLKSGNDTGQQISSSESIAGKSKIESKVIRWSLVMHVLSIHNWYHFYQIQEFLHTKPPKRNGGDRSANLPSATRKASTVSTTLGATCTTHYNHYKPCAFQ